MEGLTSVKEDRALAAAPPQSSQKSARQAFAEFLLTLYNRKYLILEMAKREIADQHLGSALGVFWSILHPVVMIVLLWIVFSLGFKAAPAQGIPFVVWLTAGMVIWITFADVLQRATASVSGSPHLVKKLRFPLSILPVVKLVGSGLLHLIFLLLLVVLLLLHGLPFSLYWLQAAYYFLAAGVLLIGLGWLSSALNIFFRDTGHLVQVCLQFGFWATPIFWDLSLMPDNLHMIFQLNPMFYVVQGYRDSFLYFVPFWEHPGLTAYFWTLALGLLALGGTVFRRLRPHFPDVI